MKKIDEILSRLREQQPDVSNPDELTDRIMDSLPDMDNVAQNECCDQTVSSKKHVRHIRFYAASAIAVAASILLLFVLYTQKEAMPDKPVIAIHADTINQKPAQLVAIEVEDSTQIQVQPAMKVVHKVKQTNKKLVAHHNAASKVDSLDYYIDKIEGELAQVSDSLYIERMNKVIQADQRLQRIVNQYIIQCISSDDKPQAVQVQEF